MADKVVARLGGGILTNAQPITFSIPTNTSVTAELITTASPPDENGEVIVDVDLDLLEIELSLDD